MPRRRRGTNTVPGVVRAKSQKVFGVTGFVRTEAGTVRLGARNNVSVSRTKGSMRRG